MSGDNRPGPSRPAVGNESDPRTTPEGATARPGNENVPPTATGPGTGRAGAGEEEEDAGEDDDPMIGRVVGGNFRIKELLGYGAMGKVYLAEQLSLDKDVAIKVLHKHLASDEQLSRRFHREAKSASLLDHPNSISIIDFGQDIDGSLYIAMEFLQGKDLARIMNEEFPLPFRRIVRILGQVCLALDEAHHQKIVHRDLKPENVMVIEKRGEEDFVKVCDFGIAKFQDPKTDNPASAITMAGIVCGTPEYMSPEQARGETLDGRSDVYALGVILYQLITGELPFSGETALGIVTKHLTETPVPPRQRRPDLDIHPALEELVLRTMAKDRDQRPPSAVALKAEMERVLGVVEGRLPYVEGEFGEGLMPTAEVRLPRKRRGRTLAVVGVSVLVVAALAIALAVRFRQSGRTGKTDSRTPPAAAVSAPDGGVVEPSHGKTTVSAVVDASVRRPSVLPQTDASSPAAESLRKRRRRRSRISPRPSNGRATPRPVEPRVPEPSRKPTFDQAFAEGYRLFSSSQYSAALAKFRLARKLNPGSAKVHKYIGQCYMRRNQVGQAVRAFKRYLRLAPGAGDAFVYRGIIQRYENKKSMSPRVPR